MGVKISKLLSNSGYIQVNKTLIKIVGIDSALFIGELCAEYDYYDNKNQLEIDGSFYSTIENIENNTGLKRKRQETCIEQLTNLGILKITLKGTPPKRYFYIDFNKLSELFTSKLSYTDKSNCPTGTNQIVPQGQIKMSYTDNLNCPTGTTNKNNIININKKNKEKDVDVDDDVQGQAAPLSSTSNFKYIDSDLKYDNKVMQALDFYFNGYVSPTTYEVLEKSKLSDDLKIYAIKKCDMAKSYNANYLRAILYGLETKGIKTIEEAEAEDNKFMQAKQNKSNDYLATKNRELDLREKELEYKKANQPNYQKMVELQYEKSQQKKQQQEDSKNQEELKAKYHDDYIAGKIERAKLKELGVSEWNLMLWDVEIYDNQPGQKEINEAWEKHKAKQYEKEKERKKWR